jgi:predicted anti-sigma-YlaC factor YlaD
MPCNNLRGQLSLFAGGDLGARDSNAVREHLKNCPSCRQEYKSFDKTRSMLGNYGSKLSEAPQGPNLWNGVFGRINQKQPKGRGPRPPQA